MAGVQMRKDDPSYELYSSPLKSLNHYFFTKESAKFKVQLPMQVPYINKFPCQL